MFERSWVLPWCIRTAGDRAARASVAVDEHKPYIRCNFLWLGNPQAYSYSVQPGDLLTVPAEVVSMPRTRRQNAQIADDLRPVGIVPIHAGRRGAKYRCINCHHEFKDLRPAERHSTKCSALARPCAPAPDVLMEVCSLSVACYRSATSSRHQLACMQLPGTVDESDADHDPPPPVDPGVAVPPYPGDDDAWLAPREEVPSDNESQFDYEDYQVHDPDLVPDLDPHQDTEEDVPPPPPPPPEPEAVGDAPRVPRKNSGSWFRYHQFTPITPEHDVRVIDICVWLAQWKSQNRVSNGAMDQLCELIHHLLLPEDNLVPPSYHLIRCALGVPPADDYVRHVCDACWTLFPPLLPSQFKDHKDELCTCENPRFRLGSSSQVLPKRRVWYMGEEETFCDLLSKGTILAAMLAHRKRTWNDPDGFWTSPAAKQLNERCRGLFINTDLCDEIVVPVTAGMCTPCWGLAANSRHAQPCLRPYMCLLTGFRSDRLSSV